VAHTVEEAAPYHVAFGGACGGSGGGREATCSATMADSCTDVLQAGPRPLGLLLRLGQLHGGCGSCIFFVVVGDEGLRFTVAGGALSSTP
jgi:hypothetical protein